MQKEDVNDFLSQKILVLYGASRSSGKFGNTVLKELSQKGYKILPVHRQADQIDGFICYPFLSALPEKPGGAVLVIPPAQTELVVQELHAAGIKRIWMQFGSQSESAISFCRKHDLKVIYDACILMFAEPLAAPHRIHRWLWKMFGKLPK